MSAGATSDEWKHHAPDKEGFSALYRDAARTPAELDLPGLRLHPLKGKLAGYWSVSISANWRIIFRLEDGDVCDVELVDYH